MNRPLPARISRSLLAATLLLVTVTGCASVKPYQREFLSDPVMDLGAMAEEERREMKWLEAREGSTGGVGGAGGGCACN